MGLADVAMYEGRYADAIALLPAAAKRDQDQGNSLGAVAKLVALAEAHARPERAAARAGGDRPGPRAVQSGQRAGAGGPAAVAAGRLGRGAGDRRRARRGGCRRRAAPTPR